jgi:hypothetical protein
MTSTGPPASHERKLLTWSLALATLTVGALLLRLVGIGYMLPYRAGPDNYVVGQMELARPGSVPGALPEDWIISSKTEQSYPWLVARVLLLWPQPRRDATRSYSLDEELAWSAEPFRRARIIVAVLGVLIVPGTFFLALGFVGPRWAILAAAFVSTSLLHVNFSQQCRPHAVVGATSILAVLAAMRLRRFGRRRDYALAVVASILAIGSLHNGVMTLLPIATAHLLRRRTPESPSGGKMSRIWPALVLPAIALAAGVALFYPIGTSRPEGSPANWLVVQQHLNSIRAFDGSGFPLLFAAFARYDPILLALSLLGLVTLSVQFLRRVPGLGRDSLAADALIAASFAVPFLIVFGLYRNTLPRYAIPLLPYLSLLAAVGVRGILRLLAPRVGHPRALATATAGLFLALPTAGAVKLVWLRNSPDSLARTAAWLEDNATPRTTVNLTPGIDLPLARRPDLLESNQSVLRFPWQMYQVARRDDPSWSVPTWNLPAVPYLDPDPVFIAALRTDPASAVRSLGASFVVVGVFWKGPIPPLWRRLYRGIKASGERVWHVAPLIDGAGGSSLEYQDCSLRAVLAARMVGPEIEIYKIR